MLRPERATFELRCSGGAWVLGAAVLLGCICAGEIYGTFEYGGDTPFKLSGILIGLGLIAVIVGRRQGRQVNQRDPVSGAI